MIRATTMGLCIVLAAAQTACEDRTPTLPHPPTPQVEPPSTGQSAPSTEQEQLDDADITSAVERQLQRDRAVIADDIKVKTLLGVVTLSGTTPNLLSKERAIGLASVIRGVRTINDRVDVITKERPDTEVQAALNSALLADPVTESFEVDVSVNKQEVTLTGTVDSWQEKIAAEHVAKSTSGVTSVTNEIAVDYKLERPDAEILADLTNRLEWDALVDDGLIRVSVEDGVATLAGSVGSLAEKNRARRDAWVSGVDSVNDDELTVEWWAKDEERRGSKYALKSAEEIEQAVNDAMLLEPRVQAFDVTPKVNAGIVTLTGTVSSLEAKYTAESLAKNTVGVTGVENQIVVAPQIALSSASLEMRVRDALLLNPITESYEVKVVADAMGVVTLTGAVDSYAEKAEAEHVTGSIVGVTEVKNLLDVERTVAFVEASYVYPYYPYVSSWTSFLPTRAIESDAEIQDDIQDELLWSPFVDEEDVTVSVDAGVATLSGAVDTWHERQSAENNAFEGGAIKVENQLKVQ